MVLRDTNEWFRRVVVTGLADRRTTWSLCVFPVVIQHTVDLLVTINTSANVLLVLVITALVLHGLVTTGEATGVACTAGNCVLLTRFVGAAHTRMLTDCVCSERHGRQGARVPSHGLAPAQDGQARVPALSQG